MKMMQCKTALIWYMVASCMLVFGLAACSSEVADSTHDIVENGGAEVVESQDEFPETMLLTTQEVRALLEGDEHIVLIDIRTPVLYSSSHIEGSRNIPAGRDFFVRLSEVPSEGSIVLIDEDDGINLGICRSELMSAGRDSSEIYALQGGLAAWVEAGNPVKTKTFHRC